MTLENQILVHKPRPLTDKELEAILPGTGIYLNTFLCEQCEVLPFSDYKIYSTRNYDSFNHLLGNRDIDEQHVHTLMESFVKDGYLFTIIYVNEKMEKIDGQHRFESAKRKHLPVYFVIMPGWGIKEVATLNVNSRNWKMENFMDMHARGGNKSYIRFKEFFDANKFDITTAQLILFGRRSKQGGSTDWFRSGEMKLEKSEMERGFVKAKRIMEFKDFHPHGYTNRSFVEAILKIMNVKGYDHKHMLEQLRRYPIVQLFDARSLRVEEYENMFIDKYNYRKKEKISLD